MEISGITQVHGIRKIESKESVQTVRMEADTVAISPEAKKKAEWVNILLHEMPDIRPEKIEAALKIGAVPHASTVAKKILETGF
jgi:hypothetical protein